MNNVTTSNSDFKSGFSTNLDLLVDIRFKLCVFVFSILVIIFNGISFVALCRTRHTPRTARFLSLALLVFENGASAALTIRKFVIVAKVNLLFQLIAFGFIFLSYVDIALMSIERLIVFQWPNFYLRRVTLGLSHKIATCVWTVYIVLWTFECIRCFIIANYSDLQSQMCFEVIITKYFVSTNLSATFLSCVCLMKITIIIVKQSNKTLGKKRSIQSHKSTVIVLLCVLNSILNSVLSVIAGYTIKEIYNRRMTSDVHTIFNGFLDTCVYVWWYKECRLELLKMFSSFFPSLTKRAENMRIKIFEIDAYRYDRQI